MLVAVSSPGSVRLRRSSLHCFLRSFLRPSLRSPVPRLLLLHRRGRRRGRRGRRAVGGRRGRDPRAVGAVRRRRLRREGEIQGLCLREG